MKNCFAVISGGGTAGHLHPGLAVANSLVEEGVTRESIIFLGSEREIDQRLVSAENFELIPLRGAGIQKRNPIAILRTFFLLANATYSAIRIFSLRKPKIILALGGYASVPGALAGLITRVPVVLHEQNAVAGRANKLISKWAKKSAVSYASTDLKKKILTGNPVRREIREIQRGDKSTDQNKLDIPNENLLVVVTGGSLGARRINEATINALRNLGEIEKLSVYHIVGRRDWEILDIPDQIESVDYKSIEYETDMPTVLNAADLIVSRAGGSITAEISVIGIPAILVPLPHAPGDHQRKNAESLVDAGAAVMINDDECTGMHLANVVKGLIDNPMELERMASESRKVGNRDASKLLATVLLEEAR